MPLHQMPNMPGAGVMTDTLDFVKNLWGSMGVPGISIPGIAAPTLSVDDLDKKISELKAVESWLALNSTMLRSSIQALEVQRGTIVALKSMGESLAAMSKPSMHSSAEQPKPAPAPEPKPEPAADKSPAKPHPAADAATAAAAQMANPALWWNMLQEQFKQAVNTAMTAEPPKAAPAAAANGVAKPKADAAPEAASDVEAEAEAEADADKPSAARKPAAKRPAKPKDAN